MYCPTDWLQLRCGGGARSKCKNVLNDVIGMITCRSVRKLRRSASQPAFVPSTLCVDSGKRHLSVWSEISALLL